MTPADWLIALAIVTSVVIGLVRGFVAEVMALIVWVVAVFASTLLAPKFSEALTTSIESSAARIFLSYGLVFVGTLLVGAVVTWMLRKLVAGTGLSGTDRLLGAIFGIVRGGALVVIVVLMLGLTPFPRESWWRQSLLLPPFVQLAERTRALLPVNVSDQIRLDGSVAPMLERSEPVLSVSDLSET